MATGNTRGRCRPPRCPQGTAGSRVLTLQSNVARLVRRNLTRLPRAFRRVLYRKAVNGRLNRGVRFRPLLNHNLSRGDNADQLAAHATLNTASHVAVVD